MPRTPVQVGFAGWGLAGRTLHAPFVLATPELELAAVVTTRAIDAALFPKARRLDTFDELIGDDSIDLVVIATPNRFHVEQTLRALAAGKHVVCDKPLAETSAEVRTLIDAARAAGRLLVPYQNRRWDGEFRTAQALVASGKLGRVHYVESRWSKYQPEPRVRVPWKGEPGFNGPMFDLFPHLIDQAIVLFGRPARVYARVEQNRPNWPLPDHVRLTLDYDRGPEVVLEVDQLDAFGGRLLRVRGERGCFEKRGFDPQEARLLAGELPRDDSWGYESPEHFGRLWLGNQSVEERVETLPGNHGIFYRGVADALVRGAPPPVHLDDVLCQIEIIEAALRSNESRQVVSLGPSPTEK